MRFMNAAHERQRVGGMSDLAEIRRFWPRAINVRLHGHKICVQPSKGSKFTLTKPHVWWCIADQRGGLWTYYERSTLAAAMAAAGFAQRPIGRYRETFNQYADRTQGKAIKHRAWHDRKYRDKPVMLFAETCRRHDDGTVAWPVLLESRQRPRKGVRLGRGLSSAAVTTCR